MDLANARVVLARDGLDRAAELIEAGARQVLFGDAALRDSAIVRQAVQAFGTERVGAWLPAHRMPVHWALDRESNADFSCVVPTCPVPRWEVLLSDMKPTGTDAIWFAGQMRGMGASAIVFAIDMEDDADLALCAEAADCLGDCLWLTYLRRGAADYLSWVRYGQARNLILPSSVPLETITALNAERKGMAA